MMFLLFLDSGSHSLRLLGRNDDEKMSPVYATINNPSFWGTQ
jgi:hypothetical protein